MSRNNEKNSKLDIILDIIKLLPKSARILLAFIGLVIGLVTGRVKMDIPNSPVNIDSPTIEDGDNNIIVQDFSLVKTIDGKSHFCYEMSINGEIKYSDVSEKKVLNSECIESIEEYEDDLTKRVPTILGYGYQSDLDNAIDSTAEIYKVKMKKKGN